MIASARRCARTGDGSTSRTISCGLRAMLRAVVICPSNPLISIEPILAVPGIRDALRACAAPVIAVSPIVGGRAIKGPTAKMMTELGQPPSAGEVARRYGDFLDGYIFDATDPPPATSSRPRVM